MNRRTSVALSCAFACALAASCARLAYVKVPSPTQYSSWSDEQQQEADEMEGVRYYLPRPFVHLKQSVPVAQRVAFVSFTRTADGGYKVVKPENPPTWLSRVLPERLSAAQALALTTTAKAGQEGGQPGATPAEGKDQATPAAADRPPSELKAKQGFINGEDPVTELGELMDVVYLPDFEEQYVIQPRGALGKVDIETRLRNGWAIEVFSQQVDNSNLIPYVIRQIESASDAAANIATTWGLKIASGGVAPSPEAIPGLESTSPDAVKKIAADVLGESLLFKVVEIRVAQPGLYPILKPRELRQWFVASPVVSGVDPQDTLEQFLRQTNLPWIRPDMAFIPCPPFTMIGFNVTTDVFMQSVTQRVDVAAAAAADRKPSGPNTSPSTTQADDIKTIVAALKKTAPNQDKVVADFVGNGSGIVAAAGPKGDSLITVRAPNGNDKPVPKKGTDDAHVEQWVLASFPNPEDETKKLTKAQIKSTELKTRAVEIVISLSPGELAAMAAR